MLNYIKMYTNDGVFININLKTFQRGRWNPFTTKDGNSIGKAMNTDVAYVL